MKPPSSLRVEQPSLLGPSTGPDPSNSGRCLSVVIFQPKVPTFSMRLPSEAMMRRFRARNARQISTSVATVRKSYNNRLYHVGRDAMYLSRDASISRGEGT